MLPTPLEWSNLNPFFFLTLNPSLIQQQRWFTLFRGDGNYSHFLLSVASRAGDASPWNMPGFKECEDFHIFIDHLQFEMPTCDVWTIYLLDIERFSINYLVEVKVEVCHLLWLHQALHLPGSDVQRIKDQTRPGGLYTVHSPVHLYRVTRNDNKY